MKKELATSKTEPSLGEAREGKKLKQIQQISMNKEQEISKTNEDQETENSFEITQPVENYFPFRILDEAWPTMQADIPHVGLWSPSCHADTFAKFCSQELTESRAVPTADGQGFVNSEGYWRLMLIGLNRRTVINTIFMPEVPEKTADVSGEPEDGVFSSALASGAFPNWFPVETLLERAKEELSGRRMVFVLDVYSHGEEKVEIVVNRAY